MPKNALIVGTGLGGLATGLRLAKKGYQVRFLEKHTQPGGRLNKLEKDGFTFDMAPTFFSMSYEFKKFVADCDFNPDIEFVKLDPLYRVSFRDSGHSYVIHENLDKLAREFEAVEPDFKAKLERYLANAGTIFHDTEHVIVKNNFYSLLDYLHKLTKVPLKHLPKVFSSFWDNLGRYFSSEEVKQIFSLVAFFLGATPFNTPAVYSLLNYTEMRHDGYYNVKGGMYKIVEEIVKELEAHGASFFYNTEVVDCVSRKGKLLALLDSTGNQWTANTYVINADAAAFRGQVFQRKAFSPKRLDKKKWTLAPLTIYLGVKGKMDMLEHHNYYLGNQFQEYASKVFTNEISLEKPYYYVNIPSRLNPEMAPEGCEAIFILVPVPDLRYKNDWQDKDIIADAVLSDLSVRTGFNIQSNLLTRQVYSPEQWQHTFNLYRGSGLGLAHDLSQVGYFRPSNKDEKFANVYYVGASTTPGTGLPMMMIGSELVTERIMQDNHNKK